MPPLSTLLESKRTPVVLDGALATYLEILGADVSSALWSASLLLHNPDLIYKTHLDYYRAGANVAITASYQASIPGILKHTDLSLDEAKGVVRKSVELAKKARDDYLQEIENSGTGAENVERRSDLLVAGSVGPYGAFLADGSEYRGDYSLSRNEYKDFHRGRIEALVEAGVDVLAVETIPSFDETCAIVELLGDEFAGTEAWVSFTLKDAEHISDGTTLAQLVQTVENSQKIVAVGINCVTEDVVLGALETLRPLTRKALVIYPNSGEHWNAETRSWYGERNEGKSLAEKTHMWRDAGARLIGGCCRTTPDDISVIAKALESSS
ncbi:homocysteine S-methyltransferase [Aaosphaeria arxii CBS 175.79]|uniref:Homocysteine S-methyltransferase n=1 Tax=Aaosphaeria arxii CBS 175.79 TaxID=1450172 RepID=A0A6A5Y1I5_9PLEO|nr:homocysteine S-methyltransferase [Aaosphaeria arxii CBS 175.79]KAF2018424.1 homocysteine S-methyltransferase [Aaosphaeria arxii CBS 175.79]